MPARSSATTRTPRSASGTSPSATRWAMPSAIAVLPTPGSPTSTGLFLVRRASTSSTCSISTSRPITGSSRAAAGLLGEVAAEPVQLRGAAAGAGPAAGLLRHVAQRAAEIADQALDQVVERAEIPAVEWPGSWAVLRHGASYVVCCLR